MSLSVVVPTHNRARLLARTIPTMLDQDFGEDFEVVVVADGCDDGTPEVLDSLACERLRVVSQPRSGAAAARNAGMAVAQSKLVLFLDDDFLCPRHLVREHAQLHADYPGSVVYGPYFVGSASPRGASQRFVNELTGDFFASLSPGDAPPTPRDCFVAANVSAPRDLLHRAGGFDVRFTPACEDVDLGYRLWKAGVRFRFAANAAAEHVYLKTARQFIWGDGPEWGRGEARLLSKHPGYADYSLIAWMVRGPRWRQAIRRAAGKAASRWQVAWSALVKLLELLPGDACLALMRYSLALAMLEGALRETGSWESLQRLVDAQPQAAPLTAAGSV